MSGAIGSGMSIHRVIDDLCRQAQVLAPRAAREALDSGCTNVRPTGPVSGRAWDMIKRAYELNSTTGDGGSVS